MRILAGIAQPARSTSAPIDCPPNHAISATSATAPITAALILIIKCPAIT
jgi:hypothetical protein